MRVLVTGGAGFIGSHMVDALTARSSAQVTVLDDLSTGRRRNLDPSTCDLVVGSVCDASLVRRLVQESDLVFHFAAAVGVSLVRKSPLRALATNVRGVDNVLAAASDQGCPVVIASSSEVYGSSERVPFAEDQPIELGLPSEMRSGYAGAKAHAEYAAAAYAAETGLCTLVVRLFNTVGPRQRARYGMVLPRFVEQAIEGRSISVFGDGSQSRCFAHVRDVVVSVLELVDRQQFGSVFNVGSEVEVKILDLARSVLEVTGSDSPIEHLDFERVHPGFGAGVRRRVPDLARLREALGGVPATPLEEIIGDVVRDRSVAALG